MFGGMQFIVRGKGKLLWEDEQAGVGFAKRMLVWLGCNMLACYGLIGHDARPMPRFWGIGMAELWFYRGRMDCKDSIRDCKGNCTTSHDLTISQRRSWWAMPPCPFADLRCHLREEVQERPALPSCRVPQTAACPEIRPDSRCCSDLIRISWYTRHYQTMMYHDLLK